MEMTIEELIENLSTIRNKICSGKYETETSLTFEHTLCIMHKYQKIKQITDDWENSGEEDDPINIIDNIEEVLEDGNE